jgi:hypothetical protein
MLRSGVVVGFEASGQEFGGWENIEMAVKLQESVKSFSSFYFQILPFSNRKGCTLFGNIVDIEVV